MDRCRCIDLHNKGSVAYACDRRSVLDEIEIELIVKHVGDPVSGNDQKQRMAVGGRTRHYLGGDLPLRARSILDDEWLAETLRQPLTNQAREDVGWTAGREADDDADRPRRVGLRESEARDYRQRGGARGQTEKISAGKFHFGPSLSFHVTRSPVRGFRLIDQSVMGITDALPALPVQQPQTWLGGWI